MSYACNSLGYLAPLPLIPDTADPRLVTQYSALEPGTTLGGNFEQFKDLAEQGGVTNDAAGYAQYLSYATQPSSAFQDRPDFVGWSYAATFAYAVVNRMHIGNYLSPLYDPTTAREVFSQSLRAMPAGAYRDAVEASFNEHFPRLLTKWGYTGSAGAPVSAIPPAPTPDPNYPPGIGLLLAQAPASTAYGNAWTPTGLVIGYRTIVRLTDGNADVSPWEATPANWLTVLPLEWRGGADALKGIYGSRYVGLDPTNAGIPQRFLDEAARELAADPYNAPGAPARLAADTAAFQAWLEGVLPTWTGSIPPPTAPAPLPPPVPIIPGSTVLQPGGGAEPQIILPGTTAPIPVSQIPTGWTDVTAPSPAPSAPTPGAPPLLYYPTPGSPYPTPTAAEPAPVLEAGIGRGLLIGGGILAAVFLLAGKRRRRTSRR